LILISSVGVNPKDHLTLWFKETSQLYSEVLQGIDDLFIVQGVMIYEYEVVSRFVERQIL
jgi:hypothetical protein